MDSLTQIVLGAAVGEAVLGKKIGNKAILYGAIAGTIPDLDVLASHFTDEVTALEMHRGFTHSILFSVLFGCFFGWVVSKYEKHKNVKDWIYLFFLGFITHPLLDAHTTWGTQFFWPFDLRLAYKTIFVIDPLYTLPFLVFLLFSMFQKRTSLKRKKYNNLGLIISSCYLLLTVALKLITYKKFEKALETQNISYTDLDTRPSFMNTVLWNANIATKDAYLLADYSLFDTKAISFKSYPKNHELLGDLIHNEKVKQMIKITEGWYTITQKKGNIYFNDLRFGLLNPEDDNSFVFRFLIKEQGTNVTFIEQEKDRKNAKKMLNQIWERVKGN